MLYGWRAGNSDTFYEAKGGETILMRREERRNWEMKPANIENIQPLGMDNRFQSNLRLLRQIEGPILSTNVTPNREGRQMGAPDQQRMEVRSVRTSSGSAEVDVQMLDVGTEARIAVQNQLKFVCLHAFGERY